MAWNGACAGLLQVAPAASPGSGVERACVVLGHTVLAFLWSRVRHALGCSRSPWPDCPGGRGEAGVGCSELHSLHSPVAWSGTCTGLLWSWQ